MTEQNARDAEHEARTDRGGAPQIRLRVQTPRGLWDESNPADAKLRPEYPPSTKVEQVIEDVRAVFSFVEQDSKYTLFRGKEVLAPERPLASYQMEDGTLLILSVQGGNA